MTRRQVSEMVFEYIKKNGFTPYDIQFGNGYFIFDKGEDGVCHFRVKGLGGWKFAMWINTNEEELKSDGEEYPALQFFCQHDLNIDKFKPSKSFHLAEYRYRELENIQKDSWWLFEIKGILKMIKRHPLIAFAMDCNDNVYYDKSYLLNYLDMKLFRIKQKIKKWWNDTFTRIWHGSKVWFISKYKVVDTVKFIDKNNENWKVYPRYDMRIHFKNLFDDEDKQENTEIKMLDTWFHKNEYNNMNVELTRDGVEHRYCYPIAKKDKNNAKTKGKK